MQSLALYVHWPFCLSKCPYCDFNSHVRDRVDHDRWRKALLTELDHTAAQLAQRTLTSIFFGGGTPSLMDPRTVEAVIDRATAHWSPDPNLEITLEANPTSVEAGRFDGYRHAGVNRVSLGVQALNDADLTALGRQHSATEALQAVELARRHFDRLSFDLIYARPGQTVSDWQAELTQAIDHAADHLSLYQLTIEPGTAFESLYRQGKLAVPDEEDQAHLYEATQETLDHAGMPAYEISNHARPGAECRHNLSYWRYDDYAGIGPGAHGRVSMDNGRIATRTHRAPEVWLDRVENQGHGHHEDQPIDAETAAEEALMMGLRLTEGIDEQRLYRQIGVPLTDLVNTDRLNDLIDAGFVEHAGGVLKATRSGSQRLNALLAALIRPAQEPAAAKLVGA